MRFDKPQDLIPWDAARPTCLQVTIQLVGPGVDFAKLRLGQRKQVRISPKALPQPVQKLQLLLGRQAVQVDLRVRHTPFSPAPQRASNAGLTPRSAASGVHRSYLPPRTGALDRETS